MKTRTLCQYLLQEACDQNVAFYRKTLEEASLDSVSDEHWRKVIKLARSLSLADQETMLAFARQATIDSISTFCGGIDGKTSLAGQFLSLSLADSDGQQHAGELQDEFLRLAEGV